MNATDAEAPFAVKPARGSKVHLASAQVSRWTGLPSHLTQCGLYYSATVAPRVDQPVTCETCKRHKLADEGQAFWPSRVRKHLGIRVGHALCSCGEISPELPSTNARRRWHREHKDVTR